MPFVPVKDPERPVSCRKRPGSLLLSKNGVHNYRKFMR